jgi:hypothetical protein
MVARIRVEKKRGGRGGARGRVGGARRLPGHRHHVGWRFTMGHGDGDGVRV